MEYQVVSGRGWTPDGAVQMLPKFRQIELTYKKITLIITKKEISYQFFNITQ